MSRGRIGIALVIAALAIAPAAVAAQQDVGVQVRDSAGRALPGVEVTILPINRKATTDESGRARFTGVEPGSYAVRGRRVGFEPGALRIQVAQEAVVATMVLRALVVTLDTVRVAEKCPWRGFSGFECRRHQTKGLFLDVAAIDSANVTDVGMLFYERPGFKVERAQRTGIPYVVSMHNGSRRCMTVLVNGLPANGTTNRPPVYAREIIAVEAYSDPREVPKDYEKFTWRSRVPCGLINYWTSTR